MHPDLADAGVAIAQGRVLVDGRVILNPNSQVRVGASIAIQPPPVLRGEAKLRAALKAFPIDLSGRTALDAGAAAGGFVRVLLEAGAARVYAVDVGHGQLLGSLRQDPRVVNLEATNLSELDTTLVPDPIEAVTLDLSYLSVAGGVRYLSRVQLAEGAALLALVKPMFELSLAVPPVDDAQLERARRLAGQAIAEAGWVVEGSIRSPVKGARGAIEFWVHARRGT